MMLLWGGLMSSVGEVAGLSFCSYAKGFLQFPYKNKYAIKENHYMLL